MATHRARHSAKRRPQQLKCTIIADVTLVFKGLNNHIKNTKSIITIHLIHLIPRIRGEG